MSDLICVDLVVGDLGAYSEANKVYNGFFDQPGPPSRACVESAALLANEVRLSALGFHERQVCH